MNAVVLDGVDFNAMSGSGVHEKVLEIAEPYLSNKKILVMGAGQGELEYKLIERGVPALNIQALDFNPKNHRVKAVDVKFCDLNGTVPVDDGSFDVCFATEVIEHLKNPHNLIEEAWRVLSPNGMLFLSTPNVHSLMQKIRYLFSDNLGWFVEADYLGSGHLHPIFDWLLERMVRGKFKQFRYTSQTFHLRLIPYVPAIPIPFEHRLFAVNNIYGFHKIP